MIALRRRKHERRKHELKLKRLELRIAQARTDQAAPAAAEPGLCRHRKAVPVRTNDGDVVAWLCTSCDTRLPREFSIYEEDL
jgi:DNA-binding IclR family transcriptional regulator